MPQHLVTSVLFDSTLSLEWEESVLKNNPARSKIEDLIVGSFKRRTAENPSLWLLILGLSPEHIPLSQSLSFWREFSYTWIHKLRTQPDIEDKRENVINVFDKSEGSGYLKRIPAMVGIDLIDLDFLGSVWDSLTRSFSKGIKSYKGSVEEYFASIHPDPQHIDRIHFHLVENVKDANKPFAFMATYSTRIDSTGRTTHLPLKHAFKEYHGHNDKLLQLLSTVKKVSRKNSFIESIVSSGEIFQVIGLTSTEAMGFLEGVVDFESAGILCRIPKWWKGAKKKASVSLSLGNKKPSKIGIDGMLDFKPEIILDGETISEAEVKRIIEAAEGLVLLKGKWVPVDTKSLERTLAVLREAKKLSKTESLTFSDAIRILMGSKVESKVGALSDSQIACGEWLSTVFEKMKNPQMVRLSKPSSNLRADLRHYQQHGLNWLSFMQSLGFGQCLADDMGLGKTIQILAHLQKLKQKERTSLIIVPASLLENWRKEIEKFTPDLNVVTIHPQEKQNGSMDEICSDIKKYDIAITTYGMLSRCVWLKEHNWFYIICDEAQAIKNPGTNQTKSVKALKSKNRCVITGTPVENRLSDLWSIFDFINPGLLGSFKEFKEFSKKVDKEPELFGQLRQVVHPYILRRSKKDKSIINDLPDKVEMKTWCTLSSHQILLYEQLISKMEDDLKTAEGIKRKGLVISCLMKCKQICNHPDHYTGSGEYGREKSGKFRRLAELCETIYEKREKVLIFTQFAEIIEPLSFFLESIFGAPGLTLSGSTSMKKRKEAVEKFQSRDYFPYFILSLKAGGVGLNLTEANHVIHFDRWWNPAVENQATDRAYRIGQKKNVIVHKFICKGTVEEKIDALIEDKKNLAEEIIPSSAENWITELDDKQIGEMFKLTISSKDIY
ncbi:Helicase, SNF2/RAD54 family [Chitinispirillum alkaliphilum]|nr:Helicase, SNF2/RAD54 family [Chitinispirillum alkaliphilum]